MVRHHTGTIEYTNDCLMPVETIYTIHILKFSAHQLLTLLACIAIVSVVFEKQRKTEEWDFQWLACAKNGARAKIKKREGKEGRFLPSLSPSPPLSFFWLSHHFSRRQNTKNPVPGTFFAPQPHGNAGYQIMIWMLWIYDYVLHVFYLFQLVLVVELLDLPFWKLCCRVW